VQDTVLEALKWTFECGKGLHHAVTSRLNQSELIDRTGLESLFAKMSFESCDEMTLGTKTVDSKMDQFIFATWLTEIHSAFSLSLKCQMRALIQQCYHVNPTAGAVRSPYTTRLSRLWYKSVQTSHTTTGVQ
jgi:hypothetical protein